MINNSKIRALVNSWKGPLQETLELQAASIDDADILAHFEGAQRPVVVRGYLNGTALEGIRFSDIHASAGHLMLDPAHKPSLMYQAAHNPNAKPMSVADYLEQTVYHEGAPRQDLYAQYRNLRVPRELRRALCLVRPSFLRPHEVNLPCIWMGGPGNCSNLHTDPQDNFVLSVIGSRRFWIHPPSELEVIGATSVFGTAFCRSSLDPREADHPAQCVQVDLGPGDLLLLPLGWPHFVECQEPTFSYNYWLDPRETPFFMRQQGTAA